MKITVFTSNQPRHLSLIESLAAVAQEIYAVQEVTTIATGKNSGVYRRSEVMAEYFSHVLAAEREIFGLPRFISSAKPGHQIYQLMLGMGDLNLIDRKILEPALNSDLYLIFGPSYIKGELCDFLVKHKAYNIHLGTSPYYRGSACNFWALYDGNPDYVGATIHLLSKGLDSGDMLFHVFPPTEAVSPFVLGMKAVQGAQQALVEKIKTGEIFKLPAVKQDKTKEIRYSVDAEFTDEIAKKYLQNLPSPQNIYQKLQKRDQSKFII